MKLLISIIMTLCVTANAYAEEALLSAQEAQFKFTFENLTLHEFNDESMGLLGGNLLFTLEDLPWLSVGAAAYGTVTGERGGFITLGFTGDAKFALSEQLSMHAGIFVGAGGGHGGYQLQGGGLMLREHMGLDWHGGLGSLELGLSRVDFPNGHVASHQGYVAYQHTFQSLVTRGWLGEPVTGQVTWSEENKHQFALTYQVYDVPKGVKTASGSSQYNSLGLAGIEWQQAINDWSFLSVASAGAMQGRSNGYMQILLGGGVYHDIGRFRLKASASAGVAGGGNVDTGGGFLSKASLAMQTMVSDNLAVELAAGWADSIAADFKARSYAVKVYQTFATPKLKANETITLSSLQGYAVEHMRVRLLHQSYFKVPHASLAWRTHHAQRDVNLLGFQNDYFLNDVWFLTGQGIAAYEGQAGGYMTGLLGVGAHLSFADAWAIEGEALLGAAGGGGLAVGGGLVWQANLGLVYTVTPNDDILLQAGRINAPKGDFVANVFSLSVGHKFSLFMH